MTIARLSVLCAVLFLASPATIAQHHTEPQLTRADTLRGSVTPQRAWWDVVKYELSVVIDPETQTIKGTNVIRYKVLSGGDVMQVDLQQPMVIDRATQDGKELVVQRDGAAHFIKLTKTQTTGAVNEVSIEFSGKPRVARMPPWDGGITWKKDPNGKHFIANANQGLGASVWWPCKDHQYDEPDNGMIIRLNVPSGLVAVSNGRLKSQKTERNKTKTFTWEVVNPINSYAVNLSVGDYVNFSEKYAGEKGQLDMQYWVLRDNLERAKTHFKDAVRTVQALEHWFGPYPFYEDSYKLVEVPYLGMEHQSSVTYGNDYKMGYRGADLSGTGEGLKWDFIIVHESGHEWFGNNITTEDIADMWVHEGFTSYSESLFTEFHYGTEAGATYTRGLRGNIQNDKPIIGTYGVNKRGSGDMYYKGHNMLHTLRQIVNDNVKWREVLRGLNRDFYHSIVTSAKVEKYIAEKTGLKLDAFFDQYLRDKRIPVLEYRVKGNVLSHRWVNCIESFDMPVTILVNGSPQTIRPTTQFSQTTLEVSEPAIIVDPDFYVYSFNILGEAKK